MKKFIELIRTKEREEKMLQNTKKPGTKDEKIQSPAHQSVNGTSPAQSQDLFWDDYSDVGYC
ncbi:MAG: hypothetical protein MUC59_12240 [Saprospiraceae bacterium]|jgi:hypothetical protein|nr:hypothetical protein [Saprospiraceae bacterium]